LIDTTKIRHATISAFTISHTSSQPVTPTVTPSFLTGQTVPLLGVMLHAFVAGKASHRKAAVGLRSVAAPGEDEEPQTSSHDESRMRTGDEAERIEISWLT
jgi:hypothetical protein